MNKRPFPIQMNLSNGFLILMCLIWISLCGCIIRKPDIQPPKEPAVTVYQVESKTIPRQLEFTGTLQAVKSVDIRSRVAGYLDSRHFIEGSIVEKDQLLYQIDPRPFQAQLDAAKAQKAQDVASLNYWEIEVRRFTALAKKGAGSLEQQQSSLARVAELKAAIERDNAEIESAQLNLGFTQITAPFTARIQSTTTNVGALVEANTDTLTTAIQVDPIYVLFNISRNQLTQIQSFELQKTTTAEPSRLENSSVTLLLPDGKPYSVNGKIDYVSAQIDSNTDMLEVRAVFKNTFQGADQVELLPGQYCPLLLDLGEIKEAVLIPQSALVQGQLGAQVYVVGADNKIQAQNVVVGPEYKNDFIILSGLTPGTEIVQEGTQKVQPGMTVTPQSAAAKAQVLATSQQPTEEAVGGPAKSKAKTDENK
ncbi:MAG: efflux RND transporter periplasmic adaptor subunit [Mariniblastus sp.]|nr:efflux RND transporter periplasmic adaptor subunit [Mariniblastus sp.]